MTDFPVAYLDGNTEYYFYVLKEHDTMIKLLEWQKELITKDFSALLKSGIDPKSWDHYKSICFPTVHAMAFFKISFLGAVPYKAHNAALMEYSEALFTSFDRARDENKILIVNKNGGYQTVDESRLSEEKSVVIAEKEKIFLTKRTNILVLENDPELDEWTQKNLKQPFSYLTSIRSFSKEELGNLMKSFLKDANGSVPCLFVYTTGLDYSQMYSYVDTALQAGFKSFVFVQSGSDEEFFYVAKSTIVQAGARCAIYAPDDKELKKKFLS